MKKILSIALVFAFCIDIAFAATPITEEKAWTETYAVGTSTPLLEISNIWGGVRVRTGKVGEIIVSVTALRTAPSEELFHMSLQRINLDIEADSNGVSILVGDRNNRWNQMDRCRGCRVDYQFDIVVPPDSVIDVGTVMDGLVDVSGVTGVVSASNVNGSISVEKIENCASINNVNGLIKVSYTKAPVNDCDIQTVNGNITLNIPDNTSLDVTADLFNGEIESDFPVDSLSLPATVEHVVKDGRNRYRIQQLSGVRIGAGGPTYSIASINGDVRIRRN